MSHMGTKKTYNAPATYITIMANKPTMVSMSVDGIVSGEVGVRGENSIWDETEWNEE